MFELLMDRGVPDMRLVLDQCTRMLIGVHAREPDRRGRCIAALWRYRLKHRRNPSRGGYVTYRDSLTESERKAFPSDNLIMAELGGPRRRWSVAMRVLGGAPVPNDVDVLALRKTRVGSKFEREALIACLRWAARALGRDSFTVREYIACAAGHASAASTPGRPSRMAASRGPFAREFGDFHAALREAGLTPVARSPRRRTRGSREEMEALVARRREARREQMLRLMRRAAADVGPDYLSHRRYDQWRAALIEEDNWEIEEGRLYCAASIQYEFETWRASREAAGLVDHHRFAGTYTDEQALRCLRDAMVFYGPRTRIAQYRTWREIQLASDPPRPAMDPLRLSVRLGGWDAGRRKVIERFGDELRAEWIRAAS
jgi:hypothetical protein